MNGTMLQGFSWYLDADGKHWKRVAEDAQLFADTGITAVWLPPAYKGIAGANDVGYGVYDTYDLGEFDQKGSVRTKYGTRDEYLAAIDAIHQAGMEALGDVALNQRMGADSTERVSAMEVASYDREQPVSGPHDITAWTRFDFPGRGDKYSAFKWNWTCFHGVDYDEATHRNGIYLFQGKHWSEQVDHHDNGNYDYLMGCDVDEMYQPVYDELLRWGEWYLKNSDLDGFRLDALKHMDRQFYLRLLPTLRQEFGKELFTVGEYWSPSADELQAYLGSERVMSLFDVPLHYHLYSASNSFGNFDLRHLFDDILVQRDATRAVTFVENHDTQPGQALQSFVQTWFKPAAYALILLRQEGYPCVFYGDLFGMPNDGHVPAVRELPLLMELRRRFAYGQQHDYIDNPDVIGWTREGDGRHGGSGLACVLTDRTGGTKRMYVGKRHAGENWVAVIGGEPDTTVDAGGNADFSCKDGMLSVYLPEDTAFVLENDVIRSGEDIPVDLKSHLPKPTDEEKSEAERLRQEAGKYASGMQVTRPPRNFYAG